jgi:hypothetical protein
MNRQSHGPIFFIIFSIIICLAAWVQYAGLFDADASWLMGCTQQFLHGGKYYTDFFETNPPMILYLYIPPVMAADFFHLSIMLTYATYIFLLGILSLIICDQFLKKIFCPNGRFFYQMLMLTLAFVYFLLPGFWIGQRENIALMFVVPYLLLVAARIEQVETKRWIVVVVGIMAGFGFAIKPHFIAPLIFIEAYLMIKNKNFFYWVRTETLAVLSVFLAYAISVFIVTPEYISKILPLVLPLYPGSVSGKWMDVLFQPAGEFLLIVVGFYFYRKNEMRYRSVAEIFIVAAIGFFVAYLLQRNAWTYHQIPFLGLTVIFASLIFADLWTNVSEKNKRLCLLKKMQAGLLVIIFLVFALPTVVMVSLANEKFKINELPLFEKTIKDFGSHGPIYFFTVSGPDTYPLITYANVQSASRFPFFAILPQLLINIKLNQSGAAREKTMEQKKEFIQIVVEDLEKKPTLLFIERVADSSAHLMPSDFDYVQFFSENPVFRQLFKNYKRIGQVMFYDIYQLQF